MKSFINSDSISGAHHERFYIDIMVSIKHSLTSLILTHSAPNTKFPIPPYQPPPCRTCHTYYPTPKTRLCLNEPPQKKSQFGSGSAKHRPSLWLLEKETLKPKTLTHLKISFWWHRRQRHKLNSLYSRVCSYFWKPPVPPCPISAAWVLLHPHQYLSLFLFSDRSQCQ